MRPKAVGGVRLPHRFAFRRGFDVFGLAFFGPYGEVVHLIVRHRLPHLLRHRKISTVFSRLHQPLLCLGDRWHEIPRSIHTFALLRLKIIGAPERIHLRAPVRHEF